MKGDTMPFTPFHIGPALLIYSLLLFIDPFALIFGSTFPDLEGFAYFITNGTTPHGPLHSIIGATLIALITATPTSIIAWKIIENASQKKIRAPSLKITVASALLGAYSHIFLDSLLPKIFYGDVNLAWPFAYWTPLLDAVTPEQMYLFCTASFIAGTIIILIRTRNKKISNNNVQDNQN
ncbi:DUF4184 family protein [Candidatus Micrarchaeota archaeon]|nr:DUF4184 family protein [Candidatus Micrarchaeota archaeon]